MLQLSGRTVAWTTSSNKQLASCPQSQPDSQNLIFDVHFNESSARTEQTRIKTCSDPCRWCEKEKIPPKCFTMLVKHTAAKRKLKNPPLMGHTLITSWCFAAESRRTAPPIHRLLRWHRSKTRCPRNDSSLNQTRRICHCVLFVRHLNVSIQFQGQANEAWAGVFKSIYETRRVHFGVARIVQRTGNEYVQNSKPKKKEGIGTGRLQQKPKRCTDASGSSAFGCFLRLRSASI